MGWTAEGVFRLVALLAYLLLALPLMWLAVPLRLFHGVLRYGLRVPNAYLPLDLVTWLFCQGLLKLAGIEARVIGKERVRGDYSVIMGNHSSGLDPFLVSGTCPLLPVYIYKRELIFLFPPLFMLGYIYGHIPIVRSKRDSAINSLSKAAKKARKYHRSICIFPEGTRSNTGELLPMKSGPFYLAQDVGSTVTPVYIYGAYTLMPPGQIVPNHKGVVIIEYQKQISAEGKTHDQLKEEVNASLQDAQARWKGKKLPSGGHSPVLCLIPLVLVAIMFAVIKRVIF